jgi:hypothetical protein
MSLKIRNAAFESMTESDFLPLLVS